MTEKTSKNPETGRDKSPDRAPEKPKLNENELTLLRDYKKTKQILETKEAWRGYSEKFFPDLRKKKEPESNLILEGFRRNYAQEQQKIQNLKDQLAEIKINFNKISGKNIEDYLENGPKKPAAAKEQTTAKAAEKKETPKTVWGWQKAEEAMDPNRGHLRKTMNEISTALPKNDEAGKKLLLATYTAMSAKVTEEKKPNQQAETAQEVQAYDQLLTALKKISTTPEKLAKAVAKLDAAKSPSQNLQTITTFLKPIVPTSNTPAPNPQNTPAPGSEKIETKGIKKQSMLILGLLLKKIPGLADTLRNLYLSITKGGLDKEGKDMVDGLLGGIFGKTQMAILKKWLKLTPEDRRAESAKNAKEEAKLEKFLKDVATRENFNPQILRILVRSNLLKNAHWLYKRNNGRDLSATQLEFLAGVLTKRGDTNAAAILKKNPTEINKIIKGLDQKYSRMSTNARNHVETLKKQGRLTSSYLLQAVFESQEPQASPAKKNPQEKNGQNPSTKPAQTKKTTPR